MDLSHFTFDGKFLMLALDHRASIKKLAKPGEDLVKLKRDIIEALKNQFSALLIDEEYGLPAYQEKTKPFLLALEKTGYITQNDERITELEYSVSQIKAQGASGAKLLVYFNPNVTSSKTQLATAKRIVVECKALNFPFFLEIVTYQHPKSVSTNLVLGSVKTFIDNEIIPDVWKLEYPGSEEGCRQLTELVGSAPWILLTGGESFEAFESRLKDAIPAGCSGFLAGRSLWQEACSLEGEEKQKFLRETLPERFKTISQIVERR